MFPSTRRAPKRVGGAPFSQPRDRHGQPGMPLSARSPTKKARDSKQVPLSARDSASQSGGRDKRLTSPCTGRAKEYYTGLMGRPGQELALRHDWTLVQEIDAMDNCNREEQEKKRVKQKNLEHQAQLRQQVQARRNITDKCRDVWKQWRTELEVDVVQFGKEEEMKKAYALEAQKHFNAERQKQLVDERRRKALEEERDSKLACEMLEMAEEAKRNLDVLDEERKQKQRRAMAQMKTQAELAVERRQAERQREHARDRKMQKEYEELLDEQDRSRGQYFQSIREKQQQLLAKYEQGIGNELAKVQALDDERARKQQEAKDQKDRKAHEEKESWRRDLAQSGRAAVQNQLALQAEERQKRRKDEVQYLEKMQKEAEIAKAKELERARKKKEAIQANAEFVRKQIQEKEASAPPRGAQQAQMTDIERQINREKLARACDPHCTDGLQALLGRKREEYRQMHLQRSRPVAMPP